MPAIWVNFQSFLSEDGGAGPPDPKSIDKSVVRAFLHHLHREGFSRRTIARRFAAVRSFFHYLCREGVVSSNPCVYLTTPKWDRHLPRFLDKSQVEALLGQPDRGRLLGLRDVVILELLYGGGHAVVGARRARRRRDRNDGGTDPRDREGGSGTHRAAGRAGAVRAGGLYGRPPHAD